MKQYAALDDTVYFWFASNDTKGSGGDGASPAADVRLAGAAADAAPVYSPTPVLLSHANYPAGAYEIAIAATEGNGFAINNVYAVFCTLAIDSQNPTGFVGSFDLKPVESNIIQIGDAVQSATDLKDFADDGYDPSENKIEGCKVNDDMRGTDSAALASVCTEARLAELAAANMPADIDAILTDTSTTLDTLIKRILGLTQENHYIDNTTFSTGKLTAARIRIYSVAGSVGTAADVIATYNITATYDANGNLETYKVVKA